MDVYVFKLVVLAGLTISQGYVQQCQQDAQQEHTLMKLIINVCCPQIAQGLQTQSHKDVYLLAISMRLILTMETHLPKHV